MDAKAHREVWKILSSLKEKGGTILLTSHFMYEVKVLCDRICILRKGKTAFSGTVSEAVKSSSCDKFEDAYLWYVERAEKTDENF